MGHGLGVTELLAGTVPEPVAALFVPVTLLGGLPFYFLALTTAYAFGERLPPRDGLLDRPSVAYLVALALGAAALTATLKGLTAHPRPPTVGVGADLLPTSLAPLYEQATDTDGFALPSGHALGSTVIYGGLATVLGAGTARQRYAAVGVVVALVSLSRLVLGVHYLGDVLAGVVLGVAYLVVVDRLSGRGRIASRAFSVATLVAAIAVLVGGAGAERLAILGAALGARLAWELVGDEVRGLEPNRLLGAATLVVALPVFGGLFGAVYALEPAAPLAFAGGAVAVGGILVTPLLGDRVVGR